MPVTANLVGPTGAELDNQSTQTMMQGLQQLAQGMKQRKQLQQADVQLEIEQNKLNETISNNQKLYDNAVRGLDQIDAQLEQAKKEFDFNKVAKLQELRTSRLNAITSQKQVLLNYKIQSEEQKRLRDDLDRTSFKLVQDIIEKRATAMNLTIQELAATPEGFDWITKVYQSQGYTPPKDAKALTGIMMSAADAQKAAVDLAASGEINVEPGQQPVQPPARTGAQGFGTNVLSKGAPVESVGALSPEEQAASEAAAPPAQSDDGLVTLAGGYKFDPWIAGLLRKGPMGSVNVVDPDDPTKVLESTTVMDASRTVARLMNSNPKYAAFVDKRVRFDLAHAASPREYGKNTATPWDPKNGPIGSALELALRYVVAPFGGAVSRALGNKDASGKIELPPGSQSMFNDIDVKSDSVQATGKAQPNKKTDVKSPQRVNQAIDSMDQETYDRAFDQWMEETGRFTKHEANWYEGEAGYNRIKERLSGNRGGGFETRFRGFLSQAATTGKTNVSLGEAPAEAGTVKLDSREAVKDERQFAQEGQSIASWLGRLLKGGGGSVPGKVTASDTASFDVDSPFGRRVLAAGQRMEDTAPGSIMQNIAATAKSADLATRKTESEIANNVLQGMYYGAQSDYLYKQMAQMNEKITSINPEWEKYLQRAENSPAVKAYNAYMAAKIEELKGEKDPIIKAQKINEAEQAYLAKNPKAKEYATAMTRYYSLLSDQPLVIQAYKVEGWKGVFKQNPDLESSDVTTADVQFLMGGSGATTSGKATGKSDAVAKKYE
jgi:hypothetical protein